MVISVSQSRESSTETMAERRFALGLGLTNECNLACAFCYRDPTRVDRLSRGIADIAKAYDAPLRINVYQSVRSDAFALTYEEYWRGFEALFAGTDAIAIGEPLVRAMAGLPPRRGGCGVATVRVTPRATVQPCVYWPGGGAPLDLLLEAARTSPTSTRLPTRAACPRRAGPAAMSGPAAAAARGAGGCSTPSMRRIPTVRSCAAAAASSRFRWREAANFPSRERCRCRR
jgi:hypothetical protein